MYGIYANIGGILMGSMLPYIPAPWILWIWSFLHILSHPIPSYPILLHRPKCRSLASTWAPPFRWLRWKQRMAWSRPSCPNKTWGWFQWLSLPLVYLWFTFGLPLVYLGLPWFTFGLPLVYLGLPWFTLVYLGLPWFTLVYLGLPWFILVYLWTWQGKKETPILTEFCCQTVSIIPDHVTGKQLLPCSPQQRNWGSSRRSCYWVLGIWSKCSPVLHIRVVWSTQRYSPSKQWLLIGRLREGPSASWEVERSVVTYKSDGKVLVGDVAVAQRGSLPCHRWMKCVGSHPFLGWKKTTGLGKIWSASIIT